MLQLIPTWFGRGFANPLRLDDTETKVALTEGEQLIIESMNDILSTGIRERPLVKRNGVPYGTRLRSTVFASETAARDVIRYETKRALTVWEPRIVVDSVDTQTVQRPNGGVAILGICSFRFRSTNRADNLVTPYVLKEGR